MRMFYVAVCLVLATLFADARQAPALAEVAQREGWVVMKTGHPYLNLVDRVEQAARNNGLGIVSKASATVGAKRLLNMTIPGNMVIGLYHPNFAVRMLDASVAAGIEAPIRVYITENTDGTATLSYKKPSHVFAPYMDEGGDALRDLATELDALFGAFANDAGG